MLNVKDLILRMLWGMGIKKSSTKIEFYNIMVNNSFTI